MLLFYIKYMNSFTPIIKFNNYGDRVYYCNVCNITSGTLVIESKNPLHFVHKYDCINNGLIPIEDSNKIVIPVEDSNKIVLRINSLNKEEDGINKINKDAMNILNKCIKNNSLKEFTKHIYTNKETGKLLSYSEMRSLYG